MILSVKNVEVATTEKLKIAETKDLASKMTVSKLVSLLIDKGIIKKEDLI